jgi:hypothetical protein
VWRKNDFVRMVLTDTPPPVCFVWRIANEIYRGGCQNDLKVQGHSPVGVHVILIPPLYILCMKSLMEYTGRCQSDYNILGYTPVGVHSDTPPPL